jgi:ligand-binding sensor domain-containing protein
MKRIVAISLFLLASLAYSQDRYRFQHLSTEDGLAHIAVNTIYQDSYGYLWFGTWNGLSRFDGYTFRNYAFDPNDPQALTHGTIYDIRESGTGELWVSTDGGLDHFIREQDRFQPYLGDCEEKNLCGSRFFKIEFDQQNRLWTSNWYFKKSGLYYWENETEGFQVALPIRAKEILNMGRYWWLLKTKGLIMFEPETMSVYPAPEILPILEAFWEMKIFKVAKGPRGNVWLATEEGLFELDNGKIRKRPGWPNSNVTSLLIDSFDGIWMGTSNGLYHQPQGATDIQLIEHDPAFSFSLSSNEINFLYEDRQGNIWIGTERGGLNKMQLAPTNWFQVFDSHDFGVAKNSLTVYAILKTRDQQQIWAGTNQGVFVFDANTHQLTRHLTGELPNLQIRSIYEDMEGNIWVGGWAHEVIRFSKAARSSYQFEVMPRGGGSIRRILEDPQGDIWMSGRELQKIIDGKVAQNVLDRLPSWNLQTAIPYIWDFQFIDSCHTWVACNQGIYLHDVCHDSTQAIHHFSAQGHHESMAVFDVHIDKKSILWAGLWGGGLAKYDLKSKQVRRYGPIHGLPGNHVYGILEDGQNNLWLSTDHGLARFNPRTEQVVKFSLVDGLMANEFDSGAFFEAEDGEMFFGGRNGLVRFRPW